MFRITRGHSVQHISFPFPVLRDLDAFDEDAAPDAAASAEAPTPVTAREDAAEADTSADAPE
jgi:hypothetical protein